MRSLVLSGFMATGKSTIGRLAAEALGVPFLDTDEVLAAEAGKPVGEIFSQEGEARFRERESKLALRLLEDPTPRVISFGGGTATIPSVRRAALDRATLVTLTAAPEAIVARVSSLAHRPNLLTAAPIDRARDLLALRREAYAECHATVATEGETPEALALRVAEIARRDLLAVPLGSRSYAVELVDGEPHRLTSTLGEMSPSSIVVVTDTTVRAARGPWLEAALSSLACPATWIEIVPGEPSKTLASVTHIWDQALAAGVDRSAVVVAFGGGVVGDLAGFAASTLLRGVRCVQIPTTSLSMVDSSVGGKTGFDHAAGKNLIGTIVQPSHVLVDLEHLSTLEPRHRTAGLAEVAKIALACDAGLLASLEAGAERLTTPDRDALRPIVRASIHAKIRVVRDDERESGPRALLNLGHTLGHALEAHGGYTRYLHGEAVSLGTVLEIGAAERLGLSPHGTAERAERLFARLGLPTRVDRDEIAAAWPFVFSDKKRSASRVKLPVLDGPGAAHVELVAFDDLRRALGF
jgi:shikimate kinase / 3-dehydroquinate synthase